MLEEVDGLWRTAQLRSQELQPLDEVRTLMGVFDETLFRLVPAVYRELSAALGARTAPAPPHRHRRFCASAAGSAGIATATRTITAQVTRETMLIQSDHILRGLEAAHAHRHRSFTADADDDAAR